MTWQQFYETVQRHQELMEAGQPATTQREEQGFTEEDLKSAFPTDFKEAVKTA